MGPGLSLQGRTAVQLKLGVHWTVPCSRGPPAPPENMHTGRITPSHAGEVASLASEEPTGLLTAARTCALLAVQRYVAYTVPSLHLATGLGALAGAPAGLGGTGSEGQPSLKPRQQ